MLHCPWVRRGASLLGAAVVSSRRSFYAGLDESRVRRLRLSSMAFNRPRGRDTLSLLFERRVQLVPLVEVGDLYKLPPGRSVLHMDEVGGTRKLLHILVVDLLSLSSVEAPVAYPAAHPSYYAEWAAVAGKVVEKQPDDDNRELSSSFVIDEESGRILPPESKRHLRQNGDSTLLRGSFLKCGEDVDVRFSVALCVNPYLDEERYRRAEAQVEMISGYRNILYEAAELSHGAADVIRIPALSCDTCGTKFQHEIGKLNQQSLIKGFHRISHTAKELLLSNPNFRVEVYVPPLLLSQFTPAFLEDAWETPDSTLNPGRTALYPGLPPPRSLLALEGWVGKRPELIEAVASEGKSLMRGAQHALDGTVVKPREVLAEIRAFGREREQQEMLEKERETAAQEGLLRGTSVDSDGQLHSGINHL